MADYRLPEVSKPAKVKKNQVLLVASGDLRPSANRNCWPAQLEMEQSTDACRGRSRLRARARASVQARRRARLHWLAKRRNGGLSPDRPQSKPDRR